MKEITGKTALITGGSRGLGRHIAHALARSSVRVALVARSEQGLKQTAGEMENKGGKVGVFPCDISTSQNRRALIDQIREEFGHIDILVNNAGLESEGAFLDLAWDTLADTIKVNFEAPVELTKLVLPEMISRGYGHVVNIASIGARAASAYDAIYCGTKAGLSEWTRALRQELRGSGVFFSTLYPGYIEDVGMFARFGIKPHWITGSCKPERVAREVVKAIQNNTREKVVNSKPMKPAFILGILFPSLSDWLMETAEVTAFQKRKIENIKKSKLP
jgi:short-subunit dehydrogenase